MSIKSTGLLEVTCNNCPKTLVLNASKLEWKCVEKTERQMGTEINYEAYFKETCKCRNAIIIKINAWEYPKGTFNTADFTITGGEIIQKNINFIVY